MEGCAGGFPPAQVMPHHHDTVPQRQAPGERRDEQPVKEDVQHAGKGQEVKRVARIPRSPQRARGKVVEHGGRYAGKHNQDIGARIGKDIRRGAHQLQQRRSQRQGQRGQRRAERQAKPGAVPKPALELIGFFGADALGQRTPAGQVHRRLGLLHFQSPPGLSFENDEGFAKVCACAPFLQKRRSSCTSPSPA